MDYFTELAKIENAISQFDGDQEKLEYQIQELKKWLKEQKHLPMSAVDRYMVEKFVLGGKGDIRKSELKLDTYFSVRNIVPELFQRDPNNPAILGSNDYMYMGILPGLTPNGARVLFIVPKSNDSSGFEHLPTAVRAFNMFDILLRCDPHTNKLYVVTDCRNGTVGHMLKVSVPMIKHNTFCLQNAYPIAVKGIIFLNMIPIVKVAVEKVVKPFFKKKLAKRFLFCDEDSAELLEKIPLSIMPKDYGGNGPSLDELNQSWIDIVNENRDWLITSASTPSDESLRDGQCPYSSTGCLIM